MSRKSLLSRGASIALGAAMMLGCATQLAAQSPTTPEQLIEMLKDKTTRSVAKPLSAAEKAKEAEYAALIQALKTQTLRGLSTTDRQREQLAENIKDRPNANLEVGFAFNSADILPSARDELDKLGKALASGEIKSSDILVAGHTDAKGTDPINQKLSERRAAAVRAYLIKNYNLAADQLIPVGYGREKLKVPDKPYADENRRVQVVNFKKAS